MMRAYRRDIDGLRSLAILPVLLFHAGVEAVQGGFVGVDVFFVISGFLITGIIQTEIDSGRFSIVTFYERRIRRILPALIVVMLFVLVGAAVLFLPSDFEKVPRSVGAALLFVANINFWLQSGYFDATSQTKPMLHMWSLAVEEQYYILFPLLLILLARLKRWRSAVLVAVALGSFVASVTLSVSEPKFAFFMLPTRAWELLAGGFLALGMVPEVKSRAGREGVALAGLTAILYAVFTFAEKDVFPGWIALIPVLGSVALLHCAPGTLVGRLLSTPLLVGIGLLSYSLYLWHWPIIVFTTYAREQSLSGIWTVATVVASLLAGYLSWRFVEKPFRDKKAVPAKRLFQQAAVASAAIALIVGVLWVGGGWPQRFAPVVAELDQGSKSYSPFRRKCHYGPKEVVGEDDQPCVLGDKAAIPTTVVWGDSHGVELSYELSEMMKPRKASLVELTSSSCAPFIGNAGDFVPRCGHQNEAVMDYIEEHRNIRTVVLTGYWASAENQARRGLPTALERTVARLQSIGKKVVLIGAIPPQSWSVPQHLAKLATRGRLGEQEGRPPAEVLKMTRALQPVFARMHARGVRYFDPMSVLCQKGRCDILRDGKPLYFDYHHLSIYGARIVARGAGPLIL